MELLIFLKSLVLGISIAIPIGPIGIICINKTLVTNKRSSIATGAGAALADGFYATIAVFSVKTIAHFFLTHRAPIEVIGGLCITYLGYQSYIKKYHELPGLTHEPESDILSIISAFLLTLSNPVTLVSFTILFAGLGLGTSSKTLSSVLVILGVITGSLLWWLTLTYGVDYLKHKFTHTTLNKVSAYTGLVLTILGCLAVISGIFKLIHFHI